MSSMWFGITLLAAALVVADEGSLVTRLRADGDSGSAKVAWKDALKQPVHWYETNEAANLGRLVLEYQTPAGGWPKNRDMSKPPGQTLKFEKGEMKDITWATIDNDATTSQIDYLARLHLAQPNQQWAEAALRGIEYLLAAQYENGGFPQFFPLRPGYYTHITFNDDAMLNVLELLTEVAAGSPQYSFVPNTVRARAQDAVRRGVSCILRTQIRVEGQLTVWCAQHDEVTLAPAKARAYELISLSGQESVGLVRFLMAQEPTAEIVASVEAAVAWFQKVEIRGLKAERVRDEKGKYHLQLEENPAFSGLWARFYEIGTNRPMFCGRDSVVHYDVKEVEPERRDGYSWFGTQPKKLLEKEYPAWRKRLPKELVK